MFAELQRLNELLPPPDSASIAALLIGIRGAPELSLNLLIALRRYTAKLREHGNLLILFMGGGLVVLLGLAALGVFTLPVAIAFFLFEVLLIATLQAFIFSTLTAIYLGESVAEHH